MDKKKFTIYASRKNMKNCRNEYKKKSISYSVGSTTTGTMTCLVLSINMNLYTI